MKRHPVLTAALLLAVLGIGTLVWVLGTPGGARWSFSMVSRWTPLRIEAGTVEGRLAGDLRLHGVKLGWPTGTARSTAVQLRWHPVFLLIGRLQIEALTVNGLVVREKSRPKKKEPAPPLRLIWPRLSGISVMVRAQVGHLRATDVVFRSGAEEPVKIDRLDAALSWRHGDLAIRHLQAAGPLFRLQGQASAGFVTPSAKADLVLDLPQNAFAKQLSLALELAAPNAAAPPAGVLRMAVVTTTAQLPRLELRAEGRVAKAAVVVRRFILKAPGRKGTLEGRSTLDLSQKTPSVRLQTELHHLDLAPEAGMPTDLSGTLELKGNLARYRGTFALANRGAGWKMLELSGPFSGHAGGVAFSDLAGRWLEGRLRGRLDLGWAEEEIAVHGSLQAEGLNPAGVRPEWPGRINATLKGGYRHRGDRPPTAEVQGRLLDSTLRGRALRGELQARLRNGDLTLDRAVLRGAGFDLAARGELKGRLNFHAEVKNLAELIPETSGNFRASGWVRRAAGEWSGFLSGEGRQLSYRTAKTERLEFRAEKGGPGRRPALEVKVDALTYGRVVIDRAEVAAHGLPDDHEIHFAVRWPQGEAHGTAAGSYRAETWKGKFLRLEGRTVADGKWRLQRPVEVTISSRRFSVSGASFQSERGESLVASADLSPNPWRGSVQARWRNLRLAHADVWTRPLTLSGSSSGHAELHLSPAGPTTLTAALDLSGKLSREGLVVGIRRANAVVEGGEKGVSASVKIDLDDGGHLEGTFHSPDPLRRQMPRAGTVALLWQDVDLKKSRPFLPATFHLEGKISGRINGRLLPDHRVDLKGQTAIAHGRLQWGGDGKWVSADLRTAELGFFWREKTLGGDVRLALADYGQVRGDFTVPLPARLPAAFQKTGPVRGHLVADIIEKGLLSAIFPGLVRESRGRLTLDLRIAGTWQQPEASGQLALADGAAFFPAAGIRLQKVAVRGRFSGQRIEIDSFQAVSGAGRLQGSADIRLSHWRPVSYRATLKGEKFQAVDLPELRLEISPDLKIEGTAKKLRVRGTIRVPHLLLTGVQTRAPVQSSPDVVIAGASVPPKAPFPMALDLQVRIVLGDHVLVKAFGADARLEGEVTVTATDAENVTGQGEIKVAEGTFSSYGVGLKITRGQVLFAGVPVDRPTLNILATRTIQTTAGPPTTPVTPTPATGSTTASTQITVGVHVTGTPRNPIVSLYSEPALADSDILAYIVLGHPLGADSGQANLLMLAAGGLLSQGQSAVLQDKIKSILGLSKLSIESGGGNVQQSMVTLGKYLTPEFYISFSQSLLTKTREVRLRYDFSKRWEVESKMGEESGVDLYYRIEFK